MSIPRDATTERLVIGACLLGGTRSAQAAAGQIVEDDFSELVNLEAWRVIRSLLEDGTPVDTIGFDQRWRKLVASPPLPPAEIIEAVDKIPSAEELPRLVTTLKEQSRRRLAFTVGNRLMVDAGDPRKDIGEATAATVAALQAGTEAPAESLDGAGAAALLVDDLERRHQLQGKLSGIATPLPALNAMTEGLQVQELSIIGARPSQGKSSLLLGIAAHAAFRAATPTLFVSLEMALPALLRRLASIETSTALIDLRRGQLSERDFKVIVTFNAKLKATPLWFFDGTSGSSVNRIAGIVRHHVGQHGVKLVMLDYLQKVRPAARHEKRTYEVSEVSQALKALAVSQHLHLCCAAQLNREPDKDSGRLPRLSDLADSSQIERDADLCMLLHRPKTTDDPQGQEAKLFLAKQRDGETGVIALRFNGPLARFEP
jgi:replicative DNA helicase